MTTLFQIQKPEAIVVGQNVNYTVPAGRVARVSVTLSVSATGRAVPAGLMNGSIATTASSDSANHLIVLRAGDVLSSTRTAASASSAGYTGSAWEGLSSSSVCVLLVNTLSALTIRAIGSASAAGNSSSNNVIVTGAADMSFVAEEYFE